MKLLKSNIHVFWNIMLCHWVSKDCNEDEGTTILQNAKNYIPNATVLTSQKTSIISSTTVST